MEKEIKKKPGFAILYILAFFSNANMLLRNIPTSVPFCFLVLLLFAVKFVFSFAEAPKVQNNKSNPKHTSHRIQFHTSLKIQGIPPETIFCGGAYPD